MTRYPIEVFWSDEDDGFIAVVPDLAGCTAWGKTEVDAIREAHDAIASWIEAAASMKRAIPPPSRPADEMAYSGKFLMRVHRRLHAEMAKAARTQGVSLNQYVLYLLTERHVQGRKAAWNERHVTEFTARRTATPATLRLQCDAATFRPPRRLQLVPNSRRARGSAVSDR